MLERFSKFIQFFRTDINSLTTKAEHIAGKLLAGKYTITAFIQKNRLESLVDKIADHLSTVSSLTTEDQTKIHTLISKISHSGANKEMQLKLQKAYNGVFQPSKQLDERESASNRSSAATTASLDSNDLYAKKQSSQEITKSDAQFHRYSRDSDDDDDSDDEPDNESIRDSKERSSTRNSTASIMDYGFQAGLENRDSDDESTRDSKERESTTTESISTKSNEALTHAPSSSKIDKAFMVTELNKIPSEELSDLLLNIFGSTTANTQKFSVEKQEKNTWKLSCENEQAIEYTLSSEDQHTIPGFDITKKAVLSTLHMPKEVSCIIKREDKNFVVSFDDPSSALFFKVEATAPESTEKKGFLSKFVQGTKDAAKQTQDLIIQQLLGSDKVGVKKITLHITDSGVCEIKTSLAPTKNEKDWTDMSNSILKKDLVQTSSSTDASAFWKQLWKSYDKKNQPD